MSLARIITTGAMAALLAACATSSSTSPTDTQSLRMRVALLEARAQRLQDINDIKRLQRAYGYYLDEGQWDDAALLFSSRAQLEIGKDGIYRGREHIRAYLRAMGDGHRGLAPGRLNEHLQVMAVVTPAPDGLTAMGTWRDIQLIGQLGKDAYWGEGPTEVQYVRENGVWKISGLHWFQTLHVPYDGGWARTGDTNAGHLVTNAPKPDAPPSVEYKTWPGAYTAPFHFRDKYPGLVPLLPRPNAEDLAVTARRVAKLADEADRLASQDEIENLQRIYGFYIDKGLWREAATLFTDDAQLEIQGKGKYNGAPRILQYLRAIGPEGAAPGRLYDHMMEQPLTHIDATGDTAHARWYLFAQLAQQGQFAEWETGIYENEYRRQNGVWKISRLHLYPTMVTPYESGWGKVSQPWSRFEPDIKPDEASGRDSNYDNAFVPKYHYRNPARAPSAAVAPLPVPAALMAQLEIAERQVNTAEDRASIENLQTAYGYYLATLQWDQLAGLFADDGTIEIAMRGVYVGRAAVRRNLDLYGQAGLDDGVLHNHMQFQMVIDVAPDGRNAKLRSRALSMMGNFNRNATWMGGNYENEFVKVGDRWMFKRDHQVNTYFAPYETGWKELAQRAPPGITDSNPPDRPPSLKFDLYPKNFLLPFHYPNPVTGKFYTPD
ncbi:MAG: nuclear transport factor 2 family protein [Pseudomonadota bacterium]